MTIPQAQHANALIRDMHALDVRAGEIARTADSTALQWKPPAGGWSAGQVLEHLCVANDSYLVVLRKLLANPSPNGNRGTSTAVWRPSLMGGLLAWSMESPRKLRAPKMLRPAPEPRDNVIAEFLARQREIVQLIEQSLSYEWRRVRFLSPVSPLFRMNLGDAFTVIVRHAERHMRQIDARLADANAVQATRIAVSG